MKADDRPLLHDGVVAIGKQVLLHGLGLILVCERTNLYMKELVRSATMDLRVESALAQRASQHFSILLPADGSNLHHQGVAGGQRRLWSRSGHRSDACMGLGG